MLAVVGGHPSLGLTLCSCVYVAQRVMRIQRSGLLVPWSRVLGGKGLGLHRSEPHRVWWSPCVVPMEALSRQPGVSGKHLSRVIDEALANNGLPSPGRGATSIYPDTPSISAPLWGCCHQRDWRAGKGVLAGYGALLKAPGGRASHSATLVSPG